MLQTHTVGTKTLDLLMSLQSRDYLQDFHLAGGTALALYYGHRKSIDIDLFTNRAFDTEQLLENLQQDYVFQIYHTSPYTLKGHIRGINVDILAHRYPYVENPKVLDGVTLSSEKDIIAMKLNAISLSGQRSKDFIDIWFALDNYSLKEMFDFYLNKYQQETYSHILKSLTYYDDVDLTDWPIMLKVQNLTWNTVKKDIEKAVLKHIQEHTSGS